MGRTAEPLRNPLADFLQKYRRWSRDLGGVVEPYTRHYPESFAACHANDTADLEIFSSSGKYVEFFIGWKGGA